MSQDFTVRLRELAEALYQEENRIQVVGRALTDAEVRRVEALRQAREWLERARDALEFAPPPRGEHGPVMRGDADEIAGESTRGGRGGAEHARGNPIENSSLAGDDDTPGYGRGGRGGR